MKYKKEKIWTRTGATRQENSVRWVQTSYTSNNASFNRGVQLPH